MKEITISQEDVDTCFNLFNVAGLDNQDNAFEEHFKSNRKILTSYKNIVFEVAGLDYFDHPHGDVYLTNDLLISKRRMRWREHRLLYVGDEVDFDYDFIDTFAKEFPVGVVVSDARRRRELLSLGNVVESEYCSVVDVPRRGDVRVYSPQIKPSLTASEWQFINKDNSH